MRGSSRSLTRLGLLLLLVGLLACGKAGEKAGKAEKATPAKPRYEMTTSMGKIVLELNPEKAPLSTANFDSYASEGYYDGTIFHRVIDNFMIQGGGFDADMVQKETHDPIPNEAANGLKNLRGTIAMARTNEVNSATSQFYINVKDNDFLNFRDSTNSRSFGYAVFGEVVEGMNVVDAIKSVETGQKNGPDGRPMGDVPLEPVTIQSVRKIN